MNNVKKVFTILLVVLLTTTMTVATVDAYARDGIPIAAQFSLPSDNHTSNQSNQNVSDAHGHVNSNRVIKGVVLTS